MRTEVLGKPKTSEDSCRICTLLIYIDIYIYNHINIYIYIYLYCISAVKYKRCLIGYILLSYRFKSFDLVFARQV